MPRKIHSGGRGVATLNSSIQAFFSAWSQGVPKKVSPEDLAMRTPPFPLPVAPHLGRWAEAFSWAPALGRKGTRSTSAFGGKLWLSSSARVWGEALADPHFQHGGWRGAPR